MSDTGGSRMAWVFVVMAALSGAGLLSGVPAGASDDHDRIRQLRASGDVIPLATLLARDDLAGWRVLEAELEDKRDRLVYELEVLDAGSGRVEKRYYDATTGEPLARRRKD